MTLSDGGHVCLDWYNDKETPPMLCDEKNRRPIVIVLPGLAGEWLVGGCGQPGRV